MPEKITPKPWIIATFQSGTVLVQDARHPDEPHFYIYGPHVRGQSDGEYARGRLKMADELCKYMNGGVEPGWLKTMVRTDEYSASSLDSRSIDVVGPFVDSNPPACNWVQDESHEVNNKRARLMDRLFKVVAS